MTLSRLTIGSGLSLEPDFDPFTNQYTVKYPAGTTLLTGTAERYNYLLADYVGRFSIIYNMEDGTTEYVTVNQSPPVPPGRFPAVNDFTLETSDDVKSIVFPIIITDGIKRNTYRITWVKE